MTFKTIGKYQHQILGSVVMAAFFAGSVGCNRTGDESIMRDETIVTESTSSGTTTANDPATSPDTLANTGAVPPTDATMTKEESTTDKKMSKKTTTKKHHEKKHHGDHKEHHKDHKDGAWNDSRSRDTDVYVYEDNRAVIENEDDLIFGEDSYDTVSGTTLGASTSNVDLGGLSPFAQEPASRIPLQIGSGQMTGKDKSVSSVEGASLFQEPSASERDRLNR